MNLAFGKIIDQKERAEIVGALDMFTSKTLSQKTLVPSIVINACDRLARSIGTEHIELLLSLGIPKKQGIQYLEEAKTMLNRDYLLFRLEKELGPSYMEENNFTTGDETLAVTEKLYPLGVLLHITAGNQYGLALYSVIEGLLTGNINIVKLSSDDDGLSGFALQELIHMEPLLADYIYLFDYPSTDTKAIGKLIDVSNAIIVWGGDRAVQAVRKMTSPLTQIIEWGHKISFAYATKPGMTKESLTGLAQNIVQTNQLLCSSCQGIYLDTESMDDIYDFCDYFLPILDDCRKNQRLELPMEIRAQNSIQIYTESLESIETPCKVFKGAHTSIVAYENNKLDISIMHGNCWVKRLPSHDIVKILQPNKNHLQTAALLCGDIERNHITNQLLKAGVVRITDGANMSKIYRGATHDGYYPLRKYMRVVSIERMI
ncbi:acyl-CoA reductase [Christensenellaceae bacterium OttesenSCG-928-K19]|nr:acyl-CoA reductase [Christensenellaceae bacterium OttesenSCG-928-K19]